MLRVVLIGLGLAALIAPAMAAPKTKAAHPPASMDVSNQRTVGLTSFVIITAGEKSKTVAKLSKPLPAGEKAKIKIAGARGCDYIARWQFEDAGDEAPIDLCHDPKVVLTD